MSTCKTKTGYREQVFRAEAADVRSALASCLRQRLQAAGPSARLAGLQQRQVIEQRNELVDRLDVALTKALSKLRDHAEVALAQMNEADDEGRVDIESGTHARDQLVDVLGASCNQSRRQLQDRIHFCWEVEQALQMNQASNNFADVLLDDAVNHIEDAVDHRCVDRRLLVDQLQHLRVREDGLEFRESAFSVAVDQTHARFEELAQQRQRELLCGNDLLNDRVHLLWQAQLIDKQRHHEVLQLGLSSAN